MKTDWITEDINSLSDRYAHIARAVEKVGVPAHRSSKPEFRTLAGLIVQQQISVSAARAIIARMDQMLPAINADAVLAADEKDFRAIGLSGQKVNYLRDLAQHVSDGRLDIVGLKKMDDAEVEAAITQVKGFGRWSAENYMIFALGRRNLWPAHDLALQEGMRKLKKLENRPNPKQMDILGARYAPHRSAMALFGWHYHGATKSSGKKQ